MTILDTATGGATDLTDAEARDLAAELLAQDPSLTGVQLGEQCGGRSGEWGRKQKRRNATRASVVPLPVRPDPSGTERVTPKRPKAARPRPATGTAPVVRAVTFVAVGTVLAVAAVASYVHIRHLADRAGMGDLAGWLPLALDGMVLACTGFLLDGTCRRKVDIWTARAGLAIGLATSLAANAVAVDPELAPLRAVRFVLAIYPPLAVAVTVHLALRMRGDR